MIGKTHRYPEFIKLINRPECFGIVTSKAVSTLYNDMGELARSRIFQQALISFPVWCCSGQHINILAVDWHIRPLKHIVFDSETLSCP
ncbi:MAG: hypothetical protein R3E39_05680 [Anaerolineae bacterium]